MASLYSYKLINENKEHLKFDGEETGSLRFDKAKTGDDIYNFYQADVILIRGEKH